MTDLKTLTKRIADINKANGFSEYDSLPEDQRVRYIIEKLWLVNSELTEAGEELRAGHEVLETYYLRTPVPATLVAEIGDVEEARRIHNEYLEEQGKLPKPEGFGTEVADAIIRLLHLVAETGLDIEALIDQKLDYNATRGHKHGGKKF
jgi:hypothetical protein